MKKSLLQLKSKPERDIDSNVIIKNLTPEKGVKGHETSTVKTSIKRLKNQYFAKRK